MKRIKKIFLVSLVVLLCCGCGKADKEIVSTSERTSSSNTEITSGIPPLKAAPSIPSRPEVNEFQPFAIYTDKAAPTNHYVSSGFMPNGKCLALNDGWTDDSRSGTCLRIVYGIQCSREGDKWAGIYWQNPANNWGDRKGGFNLTGAEKLTFWARGENGGEQIQEFIVGGIQGNYPDSDSAVLGPVVLSNEWRQYTVDLRGKNLNYISGGFGWTTNVQVNPESCIFYLDDIRFE